ncbi:MAG: glycosyltransferase family 4 protein [Desulfobacteraceae bacterium]|nr:glycosyltransferase family 4 protein [Desulfobacteraceae bacterium]
MNVLLINYEYPPIGAGAATATYHIAKELIKAGNSVTVLTSQYRDKRGAEVENGINVIRCRSLRKYAEQSNIAEMLSFLLSASLSLRSVVKSREIEAAIVFFSFPCGPLGLLCRVFLKIPYVVSLRGGDVPGAEAGLRKLHVLLRPLRRLIFRKSVAVVANSSGLKEMSERADPFLVRVIPNGVDTNFFHPIDDSEKNKNNTFGFLFVGRFRSQKNLFYLLDRFEEFCRADFQPFVLHLVGDGPQKTDLQKHAEKLGIQDKMVWYGWVGKEKIRTLYQSVDCFVNPSLYEGMPNTVLEAMACELPVVASNVPGNNDLVRHGETGFLIDLERPEEFVSALGEILANPVTAQQMGKNGRQTAIRKFSWEKVAEEYLKIFQ